MRQDKNLFIHFVAFGMICNLSVSASENEHVHISWSPHHRFECEVRWSDKADESVTFSSVGKSKSQTLLTTPRWVEVHWSPKDEWFCIDDNWDPDDNRQNFFHVLADGKVERVYSTPDTAPDAYWKLISWNLDSGIARVECNYAKDYNGPSLSWITKRYDLLLFLPEQITVDQAYQDAAGGLSTKPPRKHP